MKLEQDFKYAWRLLCKTPGFSSICVIVVALGLTVSLVIFSLVYMFRFQQPDFPNGGRYVVLEAYDKDTKQEIGNNVFNEYSYMAIRNSATEFDEIGTFLDIIVTLSDGDTSQFYFGSQTTPNLMTMTQTKPLLGRTLFPSDADNGAEPVAVISEKIWRNYYDNDPNIIGRSSRVNGAFYTIVGVMSQDFVFPNAVQDIWLPLSNSILTLGQANQPGRYFILGILKASQSRDSASRHINQVLDQLQTTNSETDFPFTVEVTNHAKMMMTGAGRVGDLFLAIAIVVLVLCCVNLSSLLVVRANARVQELAVRSAIGASPWQVALQVLMESFIICVAGITIALVSSTISINLLKTSFENASTSEVAGAFSRLALSTDHIVLALLATSVIWLLSGGVTAYRTTKSDLNRVLAGSTKGSATQSGLSMTKVIIGVEVVLSVFLVSLCGMFTAAITQIYHADYGTAIDHRYVGAFSLSTTEYETSETRQQFVEDLRDDLLQNSNIVNVAFASRLPGGNSQVTPYSLPDRDLRVNDRYPQQSVIWVADNYFDVMEVALIQGREFDSSDSTRGSHSVIVSDQFAHTLWPNELPLGKQIVLDPLNKADTLTVVGIVDHIVQARPGGDLVNRPTFYRPLAQASSTTFWVVLQTRSTITSREAAKILAESAAKINKDIPIVEVSTLSRFLETQLNVFRPVGNVFIATALVTLALAVLGIFGVVYRSVLARKLEIGVRRALGSNNFEAIAIFLKQGSVYIVVGAVIGGGLTALGSLLLTSIFTDILDYLPIMLVMSLVCIGSLVLLASYLPARKIVIMEPGDAFRYE